MINNISHSRLLMTTLAMIVYSQSHAGKINFEQELQQGCQAVASTVASGKKLYDQKQYQKALRHFKDQAAWTAFCVANADETTVKFSENNIITAQNNVALTYAKLGQPMWARAWLMINKDNKINQFNLKNLPKAKISTDLSGEYVNYSGLGEWDHITVHKQKDLYLISYSGVYMGLRSLIYGPNMGEFDTTMPLHKKQAIFKEEQCVIQLDFKSNQSLGNYIDVQQNDGNSWCGFGHNVYAGGIYYKVEK